MRCGLLDALTGRFPGGERLESVPEEEQLLHSILGNLARLFNTRQGSLAHVPSFGLPDITDVSRARPERVDALRDAIRDAVQRYEPRLQRVRVELEPQGETSPSRLVFLLVATTGAGARVELQTTIRADELVEIFPKRLDGVPSDTGRPRGRTRR